MFGDYSPLTRIGMLLTLACFFFIVGVLDSLMKASWSYTFGVILGFIVLAVVQVKSGATLVWTKGTYSQKVFIRLVVGGVVCLIVGLVAMVVTIGPDFILGLLAALGTYVGFFLVIGAMAGLMNTTTKK